MTGSHGQGGAGDPGSQGDDGRPEGEPLEIDPAALFLAGRLWERSDVARPALRGIALKFPKYAYVCGSFLAIHYAYVTSSGVTIVTVVLAAVGLAWALAVFLLRHRKKDMDRAAIKGLGFDVVELKERRAWPGWEALIGQRGQAPAWIAAFLRGWVLSRVGYSDRHTVVTLSGEGKPIVVLDPGPTGSPPRRPTVSIGGRIIQALEVPPMDRPAPPGDPAI